LHPVSLIFQKTSTSFIDRMSHEYIEYLDIVQPVQVAVYEMKLGLSLVLSTILKESFLKKLLEDNMERVLVCKNSLIVLMVLLYIHVVELI